MKEEVEGNIDEKEEIKSNDSPNLYEFKMDDRSVDFLLFCIDETAKKFGITRPEVTKSCLGASEYLLSIVSPKEDSEE